MRLLVSHAPRPRTWVASTDDAKNGGTVSRWLLTTTRGFFPAPPAVRPYTFQRPATTSCSSTTQPGGTHHRTRTHTHTRSNVNTRVGVVWCGVVQW